MTDLELVTLHFAPGAPQNYATEETGMEAVKFLRGDQLRDELKTIIDANDELLACFPLMEFWTKLAAADLDAHLPFDEEDDED